MCHFSLWPAADSNTTNIIIVWAKLYLSKIIFELFQNGQTKICACIIISELTLVFHAHWYKWAIYRVRIMMIAVVPKLQHCKPQLPSSKLFCIFCVNCCQIRNSRHQIYRHFCCEHKPFNVLIWCGVQIQNILSQHSPKPLKPVAEEKIVILFTFASLYHLNAPIEHLRFEKM